MECLIKDFYDYSNTFLKNILVSNPEYNSMIIENQKKLLINIENNIDNQKDISVKTKEFNKYIHGNFSDHYKRYSFYNIFNH